MKVNNNGSYKPASAAQVKARELEKKIKGGTVSKGPENLLSAKGSSDVKISPEAQVYQKAKIIAGSESVDEARVARLQKLIDEGKYKVDSEAVADRLVDEHLMMGE